MPNVINESGVIVCPHAGGINLTGLGAATLKGGAIPAITATGMIGAPVNSPVCAEPTGKLCTVVASCVPGSTKVTAGSLGVALDTDTVTITNPQLGPLPGTIVSAGQVALTASG